MSPGPNLRSRLRSDGYRHQGLRGARIGRAVVPGGAATSHIIVLCLPGCSPIGSAPKADVPERATTGLTPQPGAAA